MADPAPKELLKKLSGRKVQLTTHCGTFRGTPGQLKDVFDHFFLFVTTDDRFIDQQPIRNWIMMDNLAMLTEEPRTDEAGDMQITRNEPGQESLGG